MNSIQFQEVTIAHTKQLLNNPSYIGDDLLLIDDLANLPWPHNPRRINCILLAFCIEGKAQYSIDTKECMVKANDAIIMSQGTITDNYLFSHDLKGVGLMMSNQFYREIVQNVHELAQLFLYARTHPVFTLTNEQAKTLVTYFYAIKDKVDEHDHHFRNDVVSAIIKAMIFDMSNVIYHQQHTTDQRQTRAEAIFTSFIELLEQNYKVERRVSWYAQQLKITPKYLSETVKQISFRTPNDWINNYVVLEMRVMLKNSTMSIKEITEALNFPNQSFFGKYFKEHMGMSPSEYRKKN